MCIRNESGGRQLSPANGREVKADGKIASGFPCHIARDLCASSRRVIFQAAIRHQAGGAMAKNHIEKCKQSITRQKTSCPAKPNTQKHRKRPALLSKRFRIAACEKCKPERFSN